MKRLFLFCCIGFLLMSCDQLEQITQTPTSGGEPSKSEIAAGIREALVVSTKNTVQQTSRENGFYGNPKIKIPFPPEAEKVASAARNMGLGNKIDEFVKSMNRGAEKAAGKATPIFVNAIKQMSIRDVYEIWRGDNDAATQSLKQTTTNELKREFRPVIKNALDEVDVTRHWNPLISAYNQLPFPEKLNPNLDEYVLDESLKGLFTLIAEEEARIRENPQARVNDLLEKVFGYPGR